MLCRQALQHLLVRSADRVCLIANTPLCRFQQHFSNESPPDHSDTSNPVERSTHTDFPSDYNLLSNTSTQDQTAKSFRPLGVDPSSTTILLFPGQGSQFVGMGRELLDYSDAIDLFTQASGILNYDLLKICLEGPAEVLNRTEICQLATLVTSMGALLKLREQNQDVLDSCVGAAGFSVGEYAALVFAGAMSFEDAVHVVRARALAMQAASDARPSGLMTVFLKHNSKLKYAMHAASEYCRQRKNILEPVCKISNYLFPDVRVIGGDQAALEFIKMNKDEFNLKRVKHIQVSGAFHTSLMKPAAEELSSALKEVEMRKPTVPVHSNISTVAYRSPTHIRKDLVKQLYEPVKWEQTMHTLYQRPVDTPFPRTYEIGPGSQLGTILSMVNRKAHTSYNKVSV